MEFVKKNIFVTLLKLKKQGFVLDFLVIVDNFGEEAGLER